MPLGNDVVDLRSAEARPLHPRWDLRVFVTEERERLASAVSPFRMRWSLWAAKESAFKAARKLDGRVPFHPREFVVGLMEGGRAEVWHEAVGRFEVWMDEARDWVHAVALPAEGGAERASPLANFTMPRVSLAFLDDADVWGGVPGARARDLARRAVAPFLALDPEEIRVATERAIPRLFRGLEPLPVDLSLSHHGRVVACAWTGAG